MSKKPREFWISSIYEDNSPDLRATPVDQIKPFDDDCFLVREVVPIDWNKVWQEILPHMRPRSEVRYLIEQLVEKQLAGEE